MKDETHDRERAALVTAVRDAVLEEIARVVILVLVCGGGIAVAAYFLPTLILIVYVRCFR